MCSSEVPILMDAAEMDAFNTWKNTVITTKYLALVFHATEWKRQNLVLLVPLQYAKAEVILQSKSYRNAIQSAE